MLKNTLVVFRPYCVTREHVHKATDSLQTHPCEPNQNTLIQFSADPQSSLPVQTLWYLINTAH